MMKRNIYLFWLILLLLITSAQISKGQSSKRELSVNLSYFNQNNSIQYLSAQTKTRVDGKFQNVAGIPITFYINSEIPNNLIGKAITNENGYAILFIPPAAQQIWKQNAKQTFLAVSASTPQFESNNASTEITKAKIVIDTGTDKTITATFLALNDSTWQPIKSIDMKLAIKRFDGDLDINETPTYTTDSLGQISGVYKRDNLPGDSKGNIVLVAKVEDNDQFGNLSREKIVPWGTILKYNSQFDKRTLFARSGRAPIWLELIAYSIMISVWGIIIFLILQIRKVIKLGKNVG